MARFIKIQNGEYEINIDKIVYFTKTDMFGVYYVGLENGNSYRILSHEYNDIKNMLEDKEQWKKILENIY